MQLDQEQLKKIKETFLTILSLEREIEGIKNDIKLNYDELRSYLGLDKKEFNRTIKKYIRWLIKESKGEGFDLNEDVENYTTIKQYLN